MIRDFGSFQDGSVERKFHVSKTRQCSVTDQTP